MKHTPLLSLKAPGGSKGGRSRRGNPSVRPERQSLSRRQSRAILALCRKLAVQAHGRAMVEWLEGGENE